MSIQRDAWGDITLKGLVAGLFNGNSEDVTINIWLYLYIWVV